MPRTIVIGDIHGALRALEQLLGKIAPREDDRFIFVGDYVDGWSQSAQVIAYLIEFEKQHNCIFLRGNHDDWCETWLSGREADPVWLFHGGQSTVDSYAAIPREERQTHLRFFYKLRHYYEDEQNRLYIHAGFTSMHGPGKERDKTDFMWDRTLWEMALSMDKRLSTNSLLYPKRLKLFREIYIGHTPTINYHQDVPMNGCNVWNVDTGAAFTGRLSAMDADTKKVLQSDVVQRLYPFERGRNGG